MRRSTFSLVSLLALAACGGSGAKDASTVDSDRGLGEYAAQHGGLATFNRTQSAAPAGPDALVLNTVESPVTLDGMLSEWPSRFALKTVVKGAAGATAMSGAVQCDETKLYVGAVITDDKLVRSAKFADTEDHASLVLAFPNGAAYEVGFFAGKPGDSLGSVRFLSGARRGHDVPGAKIVEAPGEGGYSLEAELPWNAFPEAATVRVGLRGVLRYYQADAPGSVTSILASGPGDAAQPASLPPLPTRAESALVDQLLAAHGIQLQSPKLDHYVDVVGDGMKERVSVYDRYLTVLGPRYLGGSRFFFKELTGELVKLELRGVTGRGKPDLVMRLRSSSQGVSSEWIEVLSVLGANDPPVLTFAHAVQVESGGKKVANAVRIGDRSIDVSYEPNATLDASSFHDPSEGTEIEPLIVPWGAVKSHVFQFDGQKFKRTREVTQQATQAIGAASRSDAPGPIATRTSPPPPPPPERSAPRPDLSGHVLEQYKKDRAVAADTRPRFDLAANIGGDKQGRTPGRVVLVGRDLVVFGPGFRDGVAYAFLTLNQFASDADVREVTVKDLLGDGVSKILVRGVRYQRPEGSADPIAQELLLVYEVRGEALSRVFAAETAREQGGKRVEMIVAFSPRSIEVQPGRAVGWTERTYPWQQERSSASIEPLLLPWGSSAVRYRWDGQKFSR